MADVNNARLRSRNFRNKLGRRNGFSLPKSSNISPILSRKGSFIHSLSKNPSKAVIYHQPQRSDRKMLPALKLRHRRGRSNEPERTWQFSSPTDVFKWVTSGHTRDLAKQKLVTKIVASFARTGYPPRTGKSHYYQTLLIGKGAFGKVHLATHVLTGHRVAIKSIRKSKSAKEKAFLEASLMNSVNHDCVVRLLEVYESAKHVHLVMEHLPGGNLLDFLKVRRRLSETVAKQLFAQLVRGVQACHSAGVAHRDIKLDNVLLTLDSHSAKLCDFGVSRTFICGDKVTEQCGTPAYLAPEIVVNRAYEPPLADIWSLGVLLFILVTGNTPFQAYTVPELHKLILKGQYECPAYLSVSLQNLIDRMLQLVPHYRISLAEVLEHPWLAHTPVEPPRSPILDLRVLKAVSELGYPEDYVRSSVLADEPNHAVGTYRILSLISRDPE